MIQSLWVMWESYRMDKAVWKEDRDTKKQDDYPQQNHAPDSVALSSEIDTSIRKHNTEKYIIEEKDYLWRQE